MNERTDPVVGTGEDGDAGGTAGPARLRRQVIVLVARLDRLASEHLQLAAGRQRRRGRKLEDGVEAALDGLQQDVAADINFLHTNVTVCK